jgi:hypothetical protein
MPTLLQTIKQNSQLGQTSEEELAKLSQNSGRSAPPINPLESSTIGANPDQAKMAGTPNQKLNAINIASKPEDSLQRAKRVTPQPSAQMTTEQMAKKQELEQLSNLGNLSGRVAQIALRGIQADNTQALQIDETLTASANTDQNEALGRISSGAATSADYLAVAPLLGIDTTDAANAEELVTQVKNALQAGDSDVAKLAAEQAAGSFTLGQLTEQDYADLGLSNPAELAASLDLTEEELAGLTLDQLTDATRELQAEYFDQAREARSVLSDPASTFAAREAARAQLNMLSEAGIDDVEMQMDNLLTEIDESKTVQFMGEDVQIDELLSSEYMNTKIGLALQDEEYMDELKNEFPDLGIFIENHRNAFENLTDEVDADAAEFLAVQEDNFKLAKPVDGLPEVPTDAMKQWYPNFGEMQSERLQPNGVLSVLQDESVSKEAKAAILETINYFSNGDPNSPIIQELGTLTPAQLTQLGFTDKRQAETFRKNYEQLNDLSKLDPKLDAKQLSSQLYGGLDAKSLQAALSDSLALEASGFGKVKSTARDILDANRDGKLDPLADIQSRMLKQNSFGSLSELLAQKKNIGQVGSKLNDYKPSEISNQASSNNPVFNSIKKFFTDGKADYTETKQIAETLSPTDLYDYYSKKTPGISIGNRGVLERKINDNAVKRSNEHFSYWIGDGSNPYVASLRGLGIKSPDDIFKKQQELEQSIYKSSNNDFIREQAWRLAELERAAHWLADKTSATGLGTDNPVDKKKIDSWANRLRGVKVAFKA